MEYDVNMKTRIRDFRLLEQATLKRRENRRIIYNKHNGSCVYCKMPITLQEMHIDHVVPIKSGGCDEYFNLEPSCQRCNSIKGQINYGNDIEKLRKFILEQRGIYFQMYGVQQSDTKDEILDQILQSQVQEHKLVAETQSKCEALLEAKYGRKAA